MPSWARWAGIWGSTTSASPCAKATIRPPRTACWTAWTGARTATVCTISRQWTNRRPMAGMHRLRSSTRSSCIVPVGSALADSMSNSTCLVAVWSISTCANAPSSTRTCRRCCCWARPPSIRCTAAPRPMRRWQRPLPTGNCGARSTRKSAACPIGRPCRSGRWSIWAACPGTCGGTICARWPIPPSRWRWPNRPWVKIFVPHCGPCQTTSGVPMR
ncbi:hypothetical protein D3C71_1532490 [compost metagenome]